MFLMAVGVQARPVQVVNLCVEGNWNDMTNTAMNPLQIGYERNTNYMVNYLNCLPGTTVLEIPDGVAWVYASSNFYVGEVTIGGDTWEGVRIVVCPGDDGNNNIIPVMTVENYRSGWFYFFWGAAFMTPIAGFGLLVRVVRRVITPTGEL